jgi:Family of unknown function (DUF6069)
VTRIAVATAVAALAATAANLLLRALAVAAFDIPQPGFEPIQVRPVIISTVGAVIVAGLVYALVERVARDPDRTFRVVAGVALLASLYPPLALGLADPPENPGTDAASVGALMAMHVVTAVIVVVALTGRRRPGRGRGGRAGRRRRDPARGRGRGRL